MRTDYRCRYLALTYIPVKKYAEALTLTQRSSIYLREAHSVLSTLGADPIVIGDPNFFPLAKEEDLDQLDKELMEDNDRFKNDWFAYNGGSPSADNKDYKKPLFFDIALNYVQLDVDRLQERAGKKSTNTNINVPQQPTVLAPAPVRVAEEPAPTDKRPIAAKAKEEIERPETPEASAAPAHGGGLSTLLGGWWGRR